MDNNLRLHISKSAYEIYKENSGDKQLFSQMSDMYFWCIVLAYKHLNGKRPPSLGSNRKGELHWAAFDDTIQKPILQMIAVEVADSFHVLGPEGQGEFRNILQDLAEFGFSNILNLSLSPDYEVEKLMELLIDEKE